MKPESTVSYEIKNFKELHNAMFANLENWSDKQLNTYLLPHPLIGKLTIKEMLYFVDYHILHHQKAINIALQKL